LSSYFICFLFIAPFIFPCFSFFIFLFHFFLTNVIVLYLKHKNFCKLCFTP
jgi:hypothetical protein